MPFAQLQWQAAAVEAVAAIAVSGLITLLSETLRDSSRQAKATSLLNLFIFPFSIFRIFRTPERSPERGLGAFWDLVGNTPLVKISRCALCIKTILSSFITRTLNSVNCFFSVVPFSLSWPSYSCLFFQPLCRVGYRGVRQSGIPESRRFCKGPRSSPNYPGCRNQEKACFDRR